MDGPLRFRISGTLLDGVLGVTTLSPSSCTGLKDYRKYTSRQCPGRPGYQV
jgi:hypothetical protein